jgi:hypothetical protein
MCSSDLSPEAPSPFSNLPVECLIQVACYALFGTVSADDIELGLCSDDPVLEHVLRAVRSQLQQTTDSLDLEKLTYLELLCMRELETTELKAPPPTNDVVSKLVATLVPSGASIFLSVTAKSWISLTVLSSFSSIGAR